jgi:predicted site-specific integrase-resolvase
MIIKINTNEWTTIKKFIKINNVSKQVVSNWIRRGKLPVKYIEELDLKLVKQKKIQDI